jgi:hypothetical protein
MQPSRTGHSKATADTRFASFPSRIAPIAKASANMLIILAFIVWWGNCTDAFSGFPKGIDPYSHMTKVKYILQFFPHHEWQYHWAAGTPLLLWYAPLFYYVASLLVGVGVTSLSGSLVVTAGIALICVGMGVQQSVYAVTKNSLVSLAASLLALTSPAVWNWLLSAGLYPRLLGLGFLAISVWWSTRLVQDAEHPQSKGFRRSLVLAILLLSLSLQSHLLTGHLAIAAAMLIAFFGSRKIVSRISRPFSIGVLTVLVTAYFYVPFLLSKSASRFVGHDMPYEPAPVIDFLNPLASIEGGNSLSPLLLPLLMLLLMLFILRRPLPMDSVERGVVLALLVMTVVPMVYAGAGYLGFPSRLYIDGLIPPNALALGALFGSMLCGILGGVLLRQIRRSTRLVLLGALLGVIGLSSISQINLLRHHTVNESDPESEESLTSKYFILDSGDKQHRFAIPNATQAIWFNYRYEVPQTRDYIGYGILIPDWRFWFDKAIWDWTSNWEETDFLLNWFAVKWISTDPARAAKYEAQNARFPLLVGVDTRGLKLREFEYTEADPLLRAAGGPVASIVGAEADYEVIFRSLAHANCNSQCVIPLRGKEYIDEYALDELSSFDLVLLYGFAYRDQEKALNILADYVREGGGLIVEANGSPFDNAPSIPEPIPVSRTTATNYGTQWDLASVDHEILEGIDLSAFGPAIYDGGPWGVSSVEEADIRDWAQPILFTNGRPIIVAGQHGQGRVVWTGMNLPYHINTYRNEEESRLLAQMIEWVAGEARPQPDYDALFVHPQRREVKVLTPAKGVLFKESFFPNWHAYAEGDELQIHRAGPDFMYVPLPGDTSYPAEVILEYRKSTLEWVSLGISLATLIGLVTYAVKPYLPDLSSVPWLSQANE